MQKKEEKEKIDKNYNEIFLFGTKLSSEELVRMILEPDIIRITDQHQKYMFPRGNVDEKTRLNPGEVMAGAYVKTLKLWFPSSLGWLEDHFKEFEHLAISLEGKGRLEGIDLLTMRRALRELVKEIRPEKGIGEKGKDRGSEEVE